MSVVKSQKNSKLVTISLQANKAIVWLSRTANILGICILLGLTLLTCADVLGRALFKHPILGTVEITEYLMVCIVYFGLAWCAVLKRHISVDIILSHLKPRVQAGFNAVTLILTLGLMIIMVWQNVLETIDAQTTNKFSQILEIPAYPFMWVLTFGLALLVLVVITQIIENIVKVVGK